MDGEESAMKKGMKSMFVTTAAGGNGRSTPGQQVNSTHLYMMIRSTYIYKSLHSRALYMIVIYVRDEKPPLGEISYSRLLIYVLSERLL